MTSPSPPPDSASPEIAAPLSMREVAALFGRTPRTIRNWVKAGLLTPLPLRRGPYFDRAQIRRLCEREGGGTAG